VKLYSACSDTGIIEKLKAIASPKYIMDLGSWDGGDAIAFANAFPSARIVAVEGSPLRQPYVIRNCRQYPQIAVISAAVASKDGERVTMEHSESDGEPHCGTLKQFNREQIAAAAYRLPTWKPLASFEVITTSITTLLESIHGKATPDIMHMDIEGSEYDVLQCLFNAGRYPDYISLEVIGSDYFIQARTKDELASLLRLNQYAMIHDAISDQLWMRKA
jgi:FkbM family methyltransferase